MLSETERYFCTPRLITNLCIETVFFSKLPAEYLLSMSLDSFFYDKWSITGFDLADVLIRRNLIDRICQNYLLVRFISVYGVDFFRITC